MVIGMIPILLILSIIAAVSSLSFSTFQLAYSQGSPPTRQQQQQDLNDTTFQTANVTINGIMYPIKYNITNDDAAKLCSDCCTERVSKVDCDYRSNERWKINDYLTKKSNRL